jgi:hypothetical protein
MSTPRKRWSTFQLVMVHVIVAGVAMPWLGDLLGLAISLCVGFGPKVSLGTTLALRALGYTVGACQPWYYARKVAFHPNPSKCVMPAGVIFIILAVIATLVDVLDLRKYLAVYAPLGRLVYLVIVIYYVIVACVFLNVTTRGFRTLAPKDGER